MYETGRHLVDSPGYQGIEELPRSQLKPVGNHHTSVLYSYIQYAFWVIHIFKWTIPNKILFQEHTQCMCMSTDDSVRGECTVCMYCMHI